MRKKNVVELIGEELVNNALSKLSDTNTLKANKTEIEDALVRFIAQPIIYKNADSYINLFDDEIHKQKPYKYEFFEKLISFLLIENAYKLVYELHIIERIFTISDLAWLLKMFQKAELDKEQEFWFSYIKYFCYCGTCYCEDCFIPFRNLGLFYEVYHNTNYTPLLVYY